MQGAIILAAVAVDARARAPACAESRRPRPAELTWRQRWFPNGEWVLLLALRRRDRVLHGDRAELPHARQLLRDHAVQRRARAAGDRADAGHRHRRHRSVGRLDDGARGGRLRRARITTGTCRSPRRPSLALLVGLRRRRAERAADRRGSSIPPLIVTLGTFSLFRGIAEGLTQRRRQLHRVSARRSSALGQGYLGGVVPGAAAALRRWCVAAYVVLLHRSVVGRALYAIGFTRAGRALRRAFRSRRRVGARLRAVRRRSRASRRSSTSRISGRRKSDAGTGYELDAITAVVLGGTSVFGGRGTLVGHAARALRARRAAERPAAGGAAVGADRRADRRAAARHDRRSIAHTPPGRGRARRDRREEEFDGEEQSGCGALRRRSSPAR